MAARDNILSALKKDKTISPLNYPKGFRLGAYIHELREMGYNITTERRADTSQGYVRKIAFYTLIGRQNVIELPRKKRDNSRASARLIAFRLMMNKKLPSDVRLQATQIFNLLK
jgi:hypothetical protein